MSPAADREELAVPELRIRAVHDLPPNATGKYVLYWMTAFRRAGFNFALQRAVQWAVELKRPLVVLEGLQCSYPWASDRLHHFVVQGMADQARQWAGRRGVTYYPYVEPERNAGKGLLAALAEQACVVIGDDYPCFFLPHMVQAAARQVPGRFELIDSNGLLPLRAAEKTFVRAFDFRRFLQKNLRPHLDEFPLADPLAGLRLPESYSLPRKIISRWPAIDPVKLAQSTKYLAKLPIDHTVGVVQTSGGARAGSKALSEFVTRKLAVYDELRNKVEEDATSGLSPYLHFGHISAHQVFAEVALAEDWNPGKLAEKATGSTEGWWGASTSAEAFLDQLTTWRELGFNFCSRREDYAQYDSLPKWAQETLAEHGEDQREPVYTLEQFERAETYDELWNAAQRQLVRTGTIHNYLRMLWGKKILQWSASPREALRIMLELNNKYSLDGRDPNSYSGIFWCLGRFDRAWGPERPIFGKIRYMSSESTRGKMNVRGYLQEFGAEGAGD